MIKISLLITAVATLFVYMLPGFILRKTKKESIFLFYFDFVAIQNEKNHIS